MPFLSAEFRARLSVNSTAVGRFLRGAKDPNAAYRAPAPAPGAVALGAAAAKAQRAAESVERKLRGPNPLQADDANPMDRMAAQRLVDAGLWEAREVEALYRAWNKIRAKDGHRRKARDARTRLPTIADFYRYFRLEPSVFCTQVLLLPKRVPLEGVPVEEVEAFTLGFAEFALSTWLLCAFELSTLAFSLMDDGQKGYLTRDEVRAAVARVYSIHNTGGRGVDLFDGIKTVDKKLEKVMEGLDCNASGFVSRDEFVSFAHRYHHLLLPAFGVQRSVRERVFGTTFRWAAVERKRQRTAGAKSVQRVVDDVLPLLPELGAAAGAPRGAGEYYKHEPDADKVLDHAAMAYKNGDFSKAREIYDYHARGDSESVVRGEVVRKNAALNDLAMDSTDAAAAANLRRKPPKHASAAPVGRQNDKPFGGRRYSDAAATEAKNKRNAGSKVRAVAPDRIG